MSTVSETMVSRFGAEHGCCAYGLPWAAFVNMLNELRIGRISPATEKLFYRLQREPSYPSDGIKPTFL